MGRTVMKMFDLSFLIFLFIIGVAHPQVDAERIDMIEKPPDSVKIGERVTLKCQADSSPPIEWLKARPEWPVQQQQIYTSINSKQYTSDLGTVQESEHYFLASKEDGGATYTCKIKGTDIQSSATMNVKFPNTKTEFKSDHTTAYPLGSEPILYCRTDESNPPAVIKWLELTNRDGADPSWYEVRDNITSSAHVPGPFGGTFTDSTLTLKATKAVNNRKYKCMSVYSSGNDSTVLNSSIATMKVRWKATEVMMTEKPLHPLKDNETAKIRCETNSSQAGSPGKFVWFRNGKPITPRFSILTSSSVRDGVDHYVSDLEFEAKKDDNQARFKCRINDNEALSQETTLQVLFLPDGIKLSNSEIISWEGEHATLGCETTSSSNPPVSISIKKGGKVLSPIFEKTTPGDYGGYNTKIEVSVDTIRSDNGLQYLCIATYGPTTFAKSAHNNVKFNATYMSITEKPTQPVHEGEIINITCEAESANPPAEIQFQRKRKGYDWENVSADETVFTKKERNGANNGKIRTSQMRVTVERNDNGAEFRCLVRGQAHHFGVMDRTQVEVFYPPRLIAGPNRRLKEGGNLNLTCKVFGGNPQNYTCSWYHNDILIPSARGCTYRVEKVSYKQGGTYRCEARNYSPGGVVSGNANVDVQFKPRWNPQYPKIMSVPAVVNQSVKFDLYVIANPSPTSVTWSRQTRGKPTLELKGNAANATLTISVTGYSDFGNYTATVTNEIGVTHFVYTLAKYAATTTSIPDVTSSMNITNGSTTENKTRPNETSAGFMITARLGNNVFVLFAAHLTVYTFFFYYENLNK